MELSLHTIHARPGTDVLQVVGDRPSMLAVAPPIWAMWRGLWIVLGLQIVSLVLAVWFVPLAASTVWFGLAVLTFLEGATLERIEWRLRGWREVAWVDALTEEGAEEAYLTGRAVTP